MSKQTVTGACVKANETFYATTGQQGRDMKRKLWAEHMKRKEDAKMKPLDEWYRGISNKTAKAVTALYLVKKGRNIKMKNIVNNYDISYTMYWRYKIFVEKGKIHKNVSLNQYVLDNMKELTKAIAKAPAPTIKEVKRLYEVANPYYFNRATSKVQQKHEKRYKIDEEARIAVNQAQATGEIPVINFDVDQKHLSKSDVVVGVITGALIGGAMVAYLFMTNGAI